MFERVIQGRELDPVIAQMPKTWPKRTIDGTELPLVVPTVRTQPPTAREICGCRS